MDGNGIISVVWLIMPILGGSSKVLAGIGIPAGGSSGPVNWPDLIAGDGFVKYTPTNIVSTLGAGTAGVNAITMSSSTLSIKLNGQGRGITGTGTSGLSSINYQISYDKTGTGTFSYTGYDDWFQPGTPFECGIFEVGGTAGKYIGGQNQDANLMGSLSIDNGTVYSWKPSSTRAVIWFTGGTSGDAIFQYYLTGKVIRMHMAYFNTTGSSKAVRMARGGDPDLDAFSTNNGIINSTKVYGSSQTSGHTFAIYCPGNGYPTGTAIITGWGSTNPVVDAFLGTNAGNGDNALFAGVDCGTIAAGSEVGLNIYYCFGTSYTDAYSQIGV